jgi:EmrB/QacA subfamily drug resistance transporter
LNKKLLLFMFGLCGFMNPFIGGALNLALPSIGKEFSMNVVVLGWVVTSFLLSTTVFLLPFGRLADIHGRKRIFIIGLVAFTITSFLCSFTHTGTQLIIARVLQGMGGAMVFGTMTAILISVFPKEERGRALGWNVASIYLGSTMGPVLGGFMTQTWGWRSLFYLTTSLGIIVTILVMLFLKGEWCEAKHEKFDLMGSVVYGISLVLLLYGSTALPSMTGYVMMASGILLLVIFCVFEDHLKHPVFDIDLMVKNRVFAMSNLAALFNYCAAFALPFLLSLYLQYVKGMSPREAGLILLASPVMMMLGSPLAGKLSDRINPGIVASVGMTMVALALIALGFLLTFTTSTTFIFCMLLLFGSGLSLFSSPNTNAAMGALSPKHFGVGSSLLSTMRTVGQMTSMGISMLVMTLIIGKVVISKENLPQLIHSARISFLIFGVLCIAGVFASLARKKLTVAS